MGGFGCGGLVERRFGPGSRASGTGEPITVSTMGEGIGFFVEAALLVVRGEEFWE